VKAPNNTLDTVTSELKRTLFKDGIHYSFGMAGLSYSRLYTDLLVLSKNAYSSRKEDRKTLTEEEVYPYGISALSHAWQVVDSVNRLRELLRLAPGISKQDTEYKLFFRQTENVEHLRDNIQHLNSQIIQFTRERIPAWGLLNWVSKLDESDELLLFSFISGELFEKKTPLINPVGRKYTIPIGIITLISDKEVCLSDLVEIQVMRIADWLQKTQGINFSSPPQCMFLSAVFKPNKPDSPVAQL